MRTFGAVLFCASVLGALPAAAQDGRGPNAWPDYRGPRHDGHATGGDVAKRWGEDRNVAWKTRVHGRAWSSPVVASGEVWLTTATKDGRQLFVICIDAKSGEVVHDAKLFDVAKPQYAHPFNTYASPSPCIDGAHVYVSFGSPGTACVDRKTKKVVWKRDDLECDHFRGAGSSPVVFEDLLILTMDGADVQFVIALDKTTGKTRWRTDRSTDFADIDAATGRPKGDGDFRKGYSTPIVIEVGGKPQLISPGAKAVFAYDPRTGNEIWTVRYKGHSSASRTLFGHGLVFVNTGYSRPKLLAIKPDGNGDVTESHVVWSRRRRVAKKVSPLLIGDSLYTLDDGGIACRVDAKTGKELWHGRVGGKFSASLVYAGERIYAFSEDGEAVAWKPGEELDVVARNRLDGGFMASPAILGDAWFLRTQTHVYRIERK